MKFLKPIISLLLLLATNWLSAQCKDDTHNTNIADQWESCQTSISPNSARGMGHWIMYDLGYLYSLKEVKLWNYNVSGQTGKGFKSVAIDYSSDGTNWTQGAQLIAPEASGQSNYTGFDGPNLGGVEARYVLLFAYDSWDAGSCAGIAEFRVNVDQVLNTTNIVEEQGITVYPNPTNSHLKLEIQDIEKIKEVLLISPSGHEINRIKLTANFLNLDVSDLPPGVYFLSFVDKYQAQLVKRFVKVN